jgi:beta-mannosidase
VDANWWPSSPSPGPLSFGDAWHDDSSGDMHFWSVWHEGRDFDHYRDVKPRFCSEFGFQSYPSMDVIRRFAAPADHNIASPVMEAHQKNAGGNARIAETMFRNFRFPTTFPDFVYLSQVQQGMAIKTAVTAWRALKPHCMGTLIWQLNDTWPVCSWSSLDHGGGWKLLHHMARHFYAPITVVAVPKEGAITLRGVNDTAAAVGLVLTISAVTMAGAVRPLATVNATITTDAAQDMATVARGDLAEGEVLHWAWSGDATGADLMELAPWKAHDLLNPNVTMTTAQHGTDWAITLTAQALAPYAAVESDVAGRFSDNAFALIPGQPRTITFKPKGDGTPTFTQRDLFAATYGA